MDDFEIKVLRTKRHVIAQSVNVTSDLLQSLGCTGMLTENHIDQIMNESTHQQKAFKMLDILKTCESAATFDALCTALVKNYPWLSKELQADLKVERGALELDADVVKEAGTVVHRKFGASKRLSESDKKDIQELIAVKIQMSKEEWKHELEQVRHELETKMEIIHRKDDRAHDVDKILKRFLKDNEERLVSHAHDMSSTSDSLREVAEFSDAEPLSAVRLRIKYLTSRVQTILNERELLSSERTKCLKLLGIKDEKTRLDFALKGFMDNMPAELDRCKKEIAREKKSNADLRKKTADLEREILKKEERIKSLEEEAARKTVRLYDLEERIRVLDKPSKDFETPRHRIENWQEGVSTANRNSNGGNKGGTATRPKSTRTSKSESSDRPVSVRTRRPSLTKTKPGGNMNNGIP